MPLIEDDPPQPLPRGPVELCVAFMCFWASVMEAPIVVIGCLEIRLPTPAGIRNQSSDCPFLPAFNQATLDGGIGPKAVRQVHPALPRQR